MYKIWVIQKGKWVKQKSSCMRMNLSSLSSHSYIPKTLHEIKDTGDKCFLPLVDCWPWSAMWLTKLTFALFPRASLATFSLSWILFPCFCNQYVIFDVINCSRLSKYSNNTTKPIDKNSVLLTTWSPVPS